LSRTCCSSLRPIPRPWMNSYRPEQVAEKVVSRLISELAKFMQIHSFEEIQDLAESGELDKHLPLVPSSRSVTLGDFDKIETFDRRRFDSEAFDRYLGSLGG